MPSPPASPAVFEAKRVPLPLRWLTRLPFAAVYRLADGLAVAAYWGYPKYRRLVRDNLRRCFPELDDTARRTLARRFYRNLADLICETLRAATMTADEFAERVEFDNLELLERYRARDQPVVMLPTHQCNWEWLLLAASLRFPIPLEVVYRPLAQPRFDAMLQTIRARFGATMVATSTPAIEFRRRRGRAVAIALVADQTPQRRIKEKYWTRWFAQDTAFSLGPETVARMTRAPVLFVEMRRRRRGYYRVRFVPLAEPPYRRGDHQITERYAAAVETLIRSAPSDWLWSYQRWRYPKPDAAPGA